MTNKVKSALHILNNAFSYTNHELYLVGGCVRDLIMNRIPKDWDLTTSATPDEIKNICKSCKLTYYPTGEKYGTITVIVEDFSFETTTFRKDIDYLDGRRPTKIEFSDNIIDDLSRRDFRMNAIAINLNDYLTKGYIKSIQELILDPFEGFKDICNKEINCVGNASERFREDGLRIMRAIRFATKYDFAIGKETLDAIFENHDCLDKISYERIQNEFNQIIMNFNLNVNDLKNEIYLNKWKLTTFIIKKIFPEMYSLSNYTHNSIYHLYDVFTHSLLVCAGIKTDNLYTKLAALFHDIGKMNSEITDTKKFTKHFYNHNEESVIMTARILSRMRYSNDEITKILTLIKYHDVELKANKKSVKKLLNKIGFDLFSDFIDLRISDKLNHIGLSVSDNYKSDMLSIMNDIKLSNETFSIKNLSINGNDLIEHGFAPSPLFSKILNECVDLCIENPDYNKKEYLLTYICKKYKK